MFRLLFVKVSNRMFIRRPNGLSYSTDGSIHNILMKHLNINFNMAVGIVKRAQEKRSWGTKISRISRNCEICKEENIILTKSPEIVHCLYLRSSVLEHRIYLLREMGVKSISVKDISRIGPTMKMTVEEFKKCFDIPKEQSIADNLFRSVDEPIEMLSLHNTLNDSMKMKVYYETCLNHFKLWNLKFKSEETKYKHKHYISFSLSYSIYKFLINELEFNTEIIQKHRYLLHLSLRNIRDIVEYFRDKKIAGRDIHDVIRRWPPFLKYDLQNTISLLENFKKFGIPDEAVHYCREIFSLSYQDFVKRIKAVQENDDLNMWLDYPRILYLIVHYNVALQRVQVLKQVGLFRYANFHTITSVKHVFIKVLKGDISHAWHWNHLSYVLNKELQPNEHLVKSLCAYKNMKYIPIRDIVSTIVYLRSRYSKEDIISNIHIVFYSKSIIKDTLEKVYEEYTPEKGYDLTPSQYLKLCVYTIEKETHFSGDGILLGRESDKYIASALASFNIKSVTLRRTLPRSQHKNNKR